MRTLRFHLHLRRAQEDVAISIVHGCVSQCVRYSSSRVMFFLYISVFVVWPAIDDDSQGSDL